MAAIAAMPIPRKESAFLFGGDWGSSSFLPSLSRQISSNIVQHSEPCTVRYMAEPLRHVSARDNLIPREKNSRINSGILSCFRLIPAYIECVL